MSAIAMAVGQGLSAVSDIVGAVLDRQEAQLAYWATINPEYIDYYGDATQYKDNTFTYAMVGIIAVIIVLVVVSRK